MSFPLSLILVVVSPLFLFILRFNGILSVTILEGQLTTCHHEVGACPWEGLLNEDHRRGVVPDTQ
jgi:hypothetical protein